MRIGNYRSGGLEITLTPNEIAMLGEHHNARISATVAKNGPEKDWIKVEVDPNGLYKLSPLERTNGARSFRFRPPGPKIPIFGAETVASWSPGKGTIFGHKPKMNIPLIHRSYPDRTAAAVKKAPALSERDASFQCIHDAVKLINNFATQHSDLELAVVDGQLAVRMYIEFGK